MYISIIMFLSIITNYVTEVVKGYRSIIIKKLGAFVKTVSFEIFCLRSDHLLPTSSTY